MGRIKSRNTKTTEWRFRSLLMRAGISGWTLGHDADIPGKPDILFRQIRLAIFLDGCFWHGCRRCGSMPKTNKKFWTAKIERNSARDKKVGRALRRMGWRVMRIWEHELKSDIGAVLQKLMAKLVITPCRPPGLRFALG